MIYRNIDRWKIQFHGIFVKKFWLHCKEFCLNDVQIFSCKFWLFFREIDFNSRRFYVNIKVYLLTECYEIEEWRQIGYKMSPWKFSNIFVKSIFLVGLVSIFPHCEIPFLQCYSKGICEKILLLVKNSIQFPIHLDAIQEKPNFTKFLLEKVWIVREEYLIYDFRYLPSKPYVTQYSVICAFTSIVLTKNPISFSEHF